MIIYKIENNINGKIYIGLTTKGLSRRISEHIAENKSPIQKVLNKYGIQSFDISIIDYADTREILCEKEKYWIKYYDCKAYKGYNLTDGGDGLINPTKSVRKKISKSVSKLLKGNQYRKGKQNSLETKKKISNSLKETFKSKEMRKKLSDSHKGRVISEEQKQILREKATGRKRSDAHLFSERALKYTRKPGYVNPMKGKKRPDLSERNRLGKGVAKTFSDPKERAMKISLSKTGKKHLKEEV